MPVATTDIEEALQTYLASLAGVTALVGTRISPMRSAQGKALPRLVYQTVEEVPYMVSKGETGTRRALIHLSCWARTAEGAKELSHEVCGTPTNRRLAGYQGLMGGLVWVQMAKVSNRFAEQETPAMGDDGGEHRRLLEVVLVYNVPA